MRLEGHILHLIFIIIKQYEYIIEQCACISSSVSNHLVTNGKSLVGNPHFFIFGFILLYLKKKTHYKIPLKKSPV